MRPTPPTKEPIPEPLITSPPDSFLGATFQQQMGHISRHSLVFFAGTIFTAGTGYIFKVYLSRTLGAEALGLYALGMTIVGLVGVFDSFGLPQAAVRFLAQYRATGAVGQLRKFLARSGFLLFISNILLGLLLWMVGPRIAVHLYHTSALSRYFGLFVLIMILGASTTFLAQALAGYRDVLRRTVITNFIGTPIMMVLSAILITLGWGLRGYILAQVVGATIVLGLLLASVLKLTPSGESFLVAMFSPLESQVVSFSMLAFGVTLLEFAMAQSDKVLIGVYLNAREVGIYAVAMALVSFVSIILQSVNQIFSPTVSELHASGQHAMLARIFQTLTKWSLGLTMPLAAVMIVFAPVLMRIFGHDFEVGWPILVIGTLGQFVNCGVGSVGYLLLMSGHQRDLVKVQIFMAAGMIALGLTLIPKWGIVGAAASAAIANLVSNLWYLIEVKRKLGMSPYNSSYFRLAIPFCAMLIVLLSEYKFIFLFHSDLLVVAVALCAGYASFIGIALVGRLDSDDRVILNALWSKVSGTSIFRRDVA